MQKKICAIVKTNGERPIIDVGSKDNRKKKKTTKQIIQTRRWKKKRNIFSREFSSGRRERNSLVIAQTTQFVLPTGAVLVRVSNSLIPYYSAYIHTCIPVAPFYMVRIIKRKRPQVDTHTHTHVYTDNLFFYIILPRPRQLRVRNKRRYMESQ